MKMFILNTDQEQYLRRVTRTPGLSMYSVKKIERILDRNVYTENEQYWLNTNIKQYIQKYGSKK